MTWPSVWRHIMVDAALLAAVGLFADGAAGQKPESVQAMSPTYAIPLREGNTAIVWWDTVSDPAKPGWRCEVPAPQGGANRTIIPLRAAIGDWRAALAEARELLKGLVMHPE